MCRKQAISILSLSGFIQSFYEFYSHFVRHCSPSCIKVIMSKYSMPVHLVTIHCALSLVMMSLFTVGQNVFANSIVCGVVPIFDEKDWKLVWNCTCIHYSTT